MKIGAVFKEEELEGETVKNCTLGNRHNWILKMQKMNKETLRKTKEMNCAQWIL